MENEQVVGQSGAFFDCLERASRAAALDRPVLVIGERGTGKELIAARLHRLSARWAGPLVIVNCAALPEALIESELFGHEAGAFTGAVRAREGRFEQADGGTLFLDELACLSSPAQERLLRAVEYGEVTRVGGRPRRVDVRLVGAANEHLPDLVREKRFRADLLDRLAFEVITLPPLRVREGDVAILAEHFGRRMGSELGWQRWPGFSAGALEELERYGWPGNVRELRNVVERAVYRWGDERLAVDAIELDPFASPWRPSAPVAEPAVVIAPPREAESLRTRLGREERAALLEVLGRVRWNQREAARVLGLSYDQLRHALRRHGLLDKKSASDAGSRAP